MPLVHLRVVPVRVLQGPASFTGPLKGLLILVVGIVVATLSCFASGCYHHYTDSSILSIGMFLFNDSSCFCERGADGCGPGYV